MLPITKMITNYNKSPRNGRRIKAIVIHDVGAVSSAKNNAIYFNGGNRNSSADFFVDSTSIYQIIDYKTDYSWAIGDGRGKYGYNNSDTVSIEMCLESNGMPSETTINNTLDLTRYLMNDLGLGVNDVVRHYDCSKKNCPNSFSANGWVKWSEFKSKLTENKEDKEMVDKDWYLWRYEDVADAGFDAQIHYDMFGKEEGRKPVPTLPSDFNEGYYLYNNPDINDSVTSYWLDKGGFESGAKHWLSNYKEERSYAKPTFDTSEEIDRLNEEIELLNEKILKIKEIL